MNLKEHFLCCMKKYLILLLPLIFLIPICSISLKCKAIEADVNGAELRKITNDYDLDLPIGITFTLDIAKDTTIYKVTGKRTLELVYDSKIVSNKTIPTTISFAKSEDKSGNFPTAYEYKVTSIGSNVFGANSKKIKSLNLTENIKKISPKAFYGCKNLKKCSIYVSIGVPSIGKDSFKGINKKCKITVFMTGAKNLKKDTIKKLYKKILKDISIKGGAKTAYPK